MPLPSSKVFSGKRYERIGLYHSKGEAQAAAEKARELHKNLARVSKYTDRFGRTYYLLFVKFQRR